MDDFDIDESEIDVNDRYIINDIGYDPLLNGMARRDALSYGIELGMTPEDLIESLTQLSSYYRRYPYVLRRIKDDLDWLVDMT